MNYFFDKVSDKIRKAQYILKPKLYNSISLLNPNLFRSQNLSAEDFFKRNLQYYDCCDMEDTQQLLNQPSTLVKDTWGGVYPKIYGEDSKYLEEVANKFNFHRGSPSVQIFHNVIYFPQYHCLYTSEGKRIPESCTYRGFQARKLQTNAPEKIDCPKQLEKIAQTFIYGGYIKINHYGIFLTESISRLWYVIKEQQHPIICYGLDKRSSVKTKFVDVFFEAIKLDKNRFIFFKQPVILEKVIVPNPSFSQRNEGFEVHKILTQNIAKQVLSTKLTQNKKTSQPLYFSRTKISGKKRLIIGEDKLEKAFIRNGFAICYPETLSVDEQIYLINKHEVIIGTMGSALHNILFNIYPQKSMFCLSFKNDLRVNFLIIDAIMGIDTCYLAALEKDPNCYKKNLRNSKDNQNRIMDVEFVISNLRKAGLLTRL
ncbi:MAG: glycosyltransferase family 61 protein [Xenococcaceae cyanobacterium MO_167.B27]|nr:glycosyltransferase family 61 protein [Xenococcaceae cyanobacterium MO_167.B27]